KAVRAKELESQITGIMSLLERHANVFMDAVDRKLVPSVRTIRIRFNARSYNWLGQVLRKIFGLEAQAKPYKQAQSLASAVVERLGMEQFNVVWEQPENMPSVEELTDADAWIARVIG